MEVPMNPIVSDWLWYWPGPHEIMDNGDQPCAALVTHVHADGKVNLCAFSGGGHPVPLTGVRLWQPEEPQPNRPFCEFPRVLLEDPEEPEEGDFDTEAEYA
jgi:hypothetical protein